ncbi:PTB domain-containing adapter protein ced-6 isoform X2 [Thrips palmi]|uniref:PTB domain-containing adapter protein ced-6 isoform X2 n=1 Tax=Thrips palmi TaxID=161013 RepID=A0A6P8Y1U6_THRPL|nr:PTB domain-containing adapter protein ced-6 isoform X2 [Thrips palmi]
MPPRPSLIHQSAESFDLDVPNVCSTLGDAWGSADSLPAMAAANADKDQQARSAAASGTSSSSSSGTMAMLRSAWDGHVRPGSVRQGSIRQPLAPASLRRSFSRFKESIPGVIQKNPDTMRNTSLLKWAQNNNTKQAGNRNWIHSPDALQRGHIVYLVKFMGSTEVEQPKGIEVVKEGIRKLKFTQQLRKAEGNKIPKVELTISIDGVAIQEPKTKRIMHQYPLHRISYCADDKGEKKFFSFIAKEADAEKHVCFVFVSDKLAEDITLTIGQAFDLAYRRFLETSGKDLEVQRRLMVLTQRVKKLEAENIVLRQRLTDVSQIKGMADVEDYMQRNGIFDLLSVPHLSTSSADSSSGNTSSSMSDSSVCDTSTVSNGSDFSSSGMNTSSSKSNGFGLLLNFSSSSSTNGLNSSNSSTSPPVRSGLQSPLSQVPPAIPPRAGENNFMMHNQVTSSAPSVGTKLEGLLLDEMDEDFNPRAEENSVAPSNTSVPSVANPFPMTNGISSTPAPLLAPPPSKSAVRGRPQPMTNGNGASPDVFGTPAFFSSNTNGKAPVGGATDDPFGMGEFSTTGNNDASQHDIESAIGFLDKRLLEMKDGFSRGLTFGNEDFSLESLDPLRN